VAFLFPLLCHLTGAVVEEGQAAALHTTLGAPVTRATLGCLASSGYSFAVAAQQSP
jgi:hypothetical protein